MAGHERQEEEEEEEEEEVEVEGKELEEDKEGERRKGKEELGVDPDGADGALVKFGLVLALSMSVWFAGSVADLGDGSKEDAAQLSLSVNIGFVVSAVALSVLNVPDLVESPRTLIQVGALGCAVFNSLLAVPKISFEIALLCRFLTGAATALVYPQVMKAIASWFKFRRGFAIGASIGAIGFGSALPHAINAAGGIEDARVVILTTSAFAAAALLITRFLTEDGPLPFPRTVFRWSLVPSIMSEPNTALALAGYIGHMYELYSVWTFFSASYSTYLHRTRGGGSGGGGGGDDDDALTDAEEREVAWTTFAFIGIGLVSSTVAGIYADRVGRTVAAGFCLIVSGTCSVIAGPLMWARDPSTPTGVIVTLALIWGAAVIADSAQFSALVTEVTHPSRVGTALTLQTALGFCVSAASIWLFPISAEEVQRNGAGGGWHLATLSPGPFLGALAMFMLHRRLHRPRTCVGSNNERILPEPAPPPPAAVAAAAAVPGINNGDNNTKATAGEAIAMRDVEMATAARL